MTVKDYHEQQFFDALNDIFIGAKIEGESGYINLMRIKSRYYREGVFPQLKKDIDEAVKDFPDFREELFDKLYSFFQRYFSESGSIYFRYTPLHQNIYEKVYTDDRDVVLFWKTHMLYYVKTDRLFKSLAVEVDDVKFWFDASALELKRANEKREVIFSYREKRADGTLVFEVAYSERGRITKQEDILKALKKEGVELSDETLNKAFRVFEKQSEVDFFINKDARAFLREQFDLWMYQYLFEGQNVWSEQRLAQLQALKSIAYKVIDFISQFEDELVKIWNKPKFVRNSHYVLTIDRIIANSATPVIATPTTADTANSATLFSANPTTPVIASPDTPVIASPAGAKQSSAEGEEIASGTERPRNDIFARLLAHPNMPQQVQEWRDLGMINEDFRLEMLTQKDLTGAPLHPQYQHLPIDTKYFSDLELDILALFDDLDAALDGWLIKSENYQALKTILPKFKGCGQTIYLDPPFNTGNDFIFLDNFQDSTWLSLMDDRLELAKLLLSDKGNLYLHLDHFAEHYSKILLDKVFGPENFKAKITWNTGENISGFKSQALNWIRQADYIHHYTKTDQNIFFKAFEAVDKNNSIGWLDFIGKNANEIFIERWDDGKYVKQQIDVKVKAKGTIWNDIYSFQYSEPRITESFSFISNQKPENLLRRIIQTSSEIGGFVFDFFAGSGTTCAVAQKLNRKWVGIEMGDYFKEIYLDEAEIKKSTNEAEDEVDEVIGLNNPAIVTVLSETNKTAKVMIKKIGLLGRMKLVLNGDKEFKAIHSPVLRKPHLSKDINWQGGGFFKYYELEQYEDVLQRAHYEDSDLFHDPSQDPFHAYVFRPDLKLLESLEADAETNTVHFHPERLYPDIDLAETLSHLRGKWIKRITADYVEFEDGEQMSLTDPDWQTLKPMIWWQ
jgi:adenine-specific DNA-methyltransferase